MTAAIVVVVPSRLQLPPLRLYYQLPDPPHQMNLVYPRAQAKATARHFGWALAPGEIIERYPGPTLGLPLVDDSLPIYSADQWPCLATLVDQIGHQLISPNAESDSTTPFHLGRHRRLVEAVLVVLSAQYSCWQISNSQLRDIRKAAGEWLHRQRAAARKTTTIAAVTDTTIAA